MNDPWLDELNPQQREAVTYGGGPLLIVAGAGTGKTRTLAYPVSYLVSQGVQPERILLLTFTRRAADHSYAQCCRFFTNQVTETMDCLTDGGEPVNAGITIPETPHAGILDRIKEMWSSG